ncbi:ABC transporter ATP-binding protein [Halogeometricum luteum]|uniref:ABC transporter ATP-binding protein n=1 Tax=Halogeometricum luteum TaxID=2950537 RepID=A0ABU2FYY5_9EURY|nr:ABC transporter ATP-binding protein [Halogeometricum sp. S3BR5-2]MDS0293741.1 ABC transporter ATP-binding protein [Halogeometricum sp. S3BR5-2]
MGSDTTADDEADRTGANEGRDGDGDSRTPEGAGRDPVVHGEGVLKEYETGSETVRALKGIDFDVRPSDSVAIVGPSGSGKSTLLNLLGLLDVPTEGTVRLRGDDVSTFSDGERTGRRKRTIGFIFQSFHLIPTLTALENVEMPRMLDRTPTTTRERATALLRRVGLGDRLDHYPDELSGGQKQRVAIARALINDPAILLADEPTGNLDRDTGDRILALFDDLRAEEDVAVVTVTHDEYVAEAADRVVNLVDGEIQRETASGETAGTDP